MKTGLFFLSLFIVSISWSQSLQEANDWFDNYEYDKAAEIYSKYAESKELQVEDSKRLTYSYYVTGQHQKCLPIVETLVTMDDTEPMFYFIHAESNMGVKKYDQAIDLYKKYQSMDTEFDVTNKIASCEYLKMKPQDAFVSNSIMQDNSSRAEHTGGAFGEDILSYKELGMDSLGNSIESDSVFNAEFFIVRPFVSSKDGSVNQINFPDSIPNISIPSIALDNSTSKVYFTVMRPTSKNDIDAVPHIFIGDYLKGSYTVANIKPWIYSGYDDSTACGYATLNSAGNMMVFSKSGALTKGSDIYYSEKNSSGWSFPKVLENVNTSSEEMFPLFNGDSILSFASDGRLGYGGLDIYTASINGNEVSNVKHLSNPVNSFKDDFNFVYYSVDSARYSSNRSGGKGDDDMYFVKFREPVIEKIDTVIPFVEKWVDQMVYFDFDKFTLQKDEKIIDELIKYLKDNSDKTIILTGHTDARGNKFYNHNLGLQRANQVKDELVTLGISRSQIIAYSKGISQPQVDCETKRCSEEEHAKNRFVTIKLNK